MVGSLDVRAVSNWLFGVQPRVICAVIPLCCLVIQVNSHWIRIGLRCWLLSIVFQISCGVTYSCVTNSWLRIIESLTILCENNMYVATSAHYGSLFLITERCGHKNLFDVQSAPIDSGLKSPHQLVKLWWECGFLYMVRSCLLCCQ